MKQYDDEKLSYKGKLAVSYLLDAITESANEVEKYKAAAQKDWKIIPYKSYLYYSYQFEYQYESTSIWGIRKEEKLREASQGVYDSYQFVDKIELIDEIWEKDKAIYAENLEIAKNNLASFNGLIDLIKLMGIETRCKNPKSRKTIPDWMDCEFVTELKSKCRVYAPSLPDWSGFKRKVEEQVQKRQAAERAKELEEEKKKKEAEKTKLFLELIKKYDLTFPNGMPNVHEMTEAILSKDKYLYLAHYLQQNRNDWSDGYDYAEIGLRGFKIEGDLDREIHRQISELINEPDIDGRVFRPIYERLFSMVDQDLLSSYVKLKDYL
jgi:hypothetical protein